MCVPLAARGNVPLGPDPWPCQRESAGRREMLYGSRGIPIFGVSHNTHRLERDRFFFRAPFRAVNPAFDMISRAMAPNPRAVGCISLPQYFS